MSANSELDEFVKDNFGVDVDTLIEALELSPNAQGYLDGAITELLLKRYLEGNGYELLRIKEKWSGPKVHHGDFYIRKIGGTDWFVLESKGLKSNSEAWNSFYNKSRLISFMSKPENLKRTPFKTAKQLEDYIKKELPAFQNKYKIDTYTQNEIDKYKPKRESEKSKIITSLKKKGYAYVDAQISERTKYVMTKIKIMDTHFVAGKSGNRKIATPRVDEFGIASIDLFLRTGKHEFIFVDPTKLVPSSKDPNHLQQNYIISFIIKGLQDDPVIPKPWCKDFDEIFATLLNPVKESEMQVDSRLNVH